MGYSDDALELRTSSPPPQLPPGVSVLVVMWVEAVPEHLRGLISRYLAEVRTGLYVGPTSARVADSLWERTTSHTPSGEVVQVRHTPEDPGYEIRYHGDPDHRVLDLDGLQLPIRARQSEAPDA